MFAERFSPLITKYPQEADALARLEAYFRSYESRKGDEYKRIKLEPQRLFEISQAGSSVRLANVISLLLLEGLLERILVVVSPGGGGIKTFRSQAEIPRVIHDTRLDVELEVTEDNVQTYYQPAGE